MTAPAVRASMIADQTAIPILAASVFSAGAFTSSRSTANFGQGSFTSLPLRVMK